MIDKNKNKEVEDIISATPKAIRRAKFIWKADDEIFFFQIEGPPKSEITGDITPSFTADALKTHRDAPETTLNPTGDCYTCRYHVE